MSFRGYPTSRPTGNPALPTVPSHWDVRRLAHCGTFLKGSGGSKDDIVDDGLPCVRYGDLYTTHSFFIQQSRTRIARDVASNYTPIRYGDLLFAASGETFEEIGKSAVNLIEGESYCGGDVIILRPRIPADARFLGYAADSQNAAAQKASLGRGTTVKHIYPDQLKRVVIAIPPQEEQRAIAAFLDRETAKIDALVTEQERLIELLREKRKAVISHVVTKGLNPHAPMKPSGIEWLGDVPAHWVLKRLKHISPSLTVGIVVNPSTFIADEGLPFIYGGDIREGVIDWQSARRISAEASDLHLKTRLLSGDLLMVRVGAPGVTAVVPQECEGGNCASVMLIRRGHFSSDWLCHVLNTRIVRFQVEVVQYGAAQEQFNIGHAVDFWVPVPPREEQDEIVQALRERTEETDLLTVEAERAIDLLRERRTALISAAVTGQIDVRGLAKPEAA